MSNVRASSGEPAAGPPGSLTGVTLMRFSNRFDDRSCRGAGFFLQPCWDVTKGCATEYSGSKLRHIWTLERIHHFACAAGWPELGQAMREPGSLQNKEALEQGVKMA